MAAPVALALAVSGAAAQPEGAVALDIPAQPLVSALEQYGDATGREVLYSAALAEGRRSGAVRGVFAPETALRLLLEGTGLSARFLPDRSFVLTPAAPAARAAAARMPDAAARRGYYAQIQAGLRQALCAAGEARPGSYRVSILFWLGPSGDVVRHERLASTGRAGTDRAIDAALGGLRFGPPPPGFAQPVLVTVLPRGAGVTMACDPAEADPRPASPRPASLRPADPRPADPRPAEAAP